jgi:hypothetical protein
LGPLKIGGLKIPRQTNKYLGPEFEISPQNKQVSHFEKLEYSRYLVIRSLRVKPVDCAFNEMSQNFLSPL